MSKVFLALQLSDDSRSIIEAVLADNPHATLNEQPAMVRIDAEGHLSVKRESIAACMGRPFDLQELHLSLISLSGNIDETDDEFNLSWTH